jgi:long-chain acyl-CoA synthetase
LRRVYVVPKRIFLVIENELGVHPEVRSIDTLLDLLNDVFEHPDRDALAERDPFGNWHTTRLSSLKQRVRAIAMGLRARGIAPGDRVGLMSPNRVDWIVTNLGILSAGAVTVPIYATQAHDQVAHILADSEATLLIVDSDATVEALRHGGVTLPPAISFDGSGANGLAALEAAGRSARDADLAAIAARLTPRDLAVLIYTSGTTGTPKGVMLTHGNITSNVVSSFALVEHLLGPGDPVLSILPYAHIYESTNVFGYLLRGTTVYVNRAIEKLLFDLVSVRPKMVFAVPRVFERMLGAMVTRAKSEGGVRAKLIPWALHTGRDYMRAKHTGAPILSSLRLQYALAHVLVLKQIAPKLGLDRLEFFCSGSAPLHPDTAYTFLGADIKIVEGYGLTECSPVVTCTIPGQAKVGTVGKAIAGVELTLAADGELLVRGPNVMQGYYHDDAATANVMDNGWFHTGDIASIDPDGNVRITDRKKELFKTSGGKFVAPARVESAILRSPYINQVMVTGNGRPHPAALVAPNWPLVRKELDLSDAATSEELSRRSDVHAFLQREVMTLTADLGSFEQIRWIGVLPRDLTIDDGELSPTQKIKRRIVEERYADLIERVFATAA